MDLSRKLDATKWIELYGDALLNYASARVQNILQAEDIVQDTFLSAWKARDSYNGLASEKNWLYAICKNKIIDFYRKASTTKEVYKSEELTDDYFFAENGHWKNKSQPKYWSIDYQNNIENKEFYKILSNCKSKLKEVQEMAFTMKYLEGLKTDEICELLGITVQNYWVIIHRAKIQLRDCLEKNWINI